MTGAVSRDWAPGLRPLLEPAAIRRRVEELGRQITADYQGRELTALVVLKGSFVFAADLLRRIELPLAVEFIGLRSYGSRTSTSGVVEITLDAKYPLVDKHVLIVEDIVDTGLTLSFLRENLATRLPASIRLAALLHKPARTVKPVPIDYLGFTIADEFVVGYGLDHDGRHRNLPGIALLDDPAQLRLFETENDSRGRVDQWK
jgi:hypoxanthine phosphoribosyltransferase